MKNNLLKIALVAMMIIAISFSGCTEQTDTADAESTSQQETTADSTSELPVENDDRPEPGLDSEGNEIGIDEEVDGQPDGPGEQQEMPDLAAAADELGVTQEELEAALGDPGQGSPDFAAAAAELGVTEEVLMEALGVSASGSPNGGGQPPADQS